MQQQTTHARFHSTFGRALVLLLLLSACGNTSVIAPRPTVQPSPTPTGKAEALSGTKTTQEAKGDAYPLGPINKEGEDESNPPFKPVPDGPFLPRTSLPPQTVITPLNGKPSAIAVPDRALSAVVPQRALFPNIDTNVSLHSINATYAATEVSEASNGNTAFVTGNWDAYLTSDGGGHFSEVNPYTMFPAADGGFCCDQVVTYSNRIDRFFWVLQYNQQPAGGARPNENRYRLAYNSTAGMVSSGATAWTYIDLPSQLFGVTGNWMDFPELALGANSLYLTTDALGYGELIMRIGFDQLTPLGAGHTVGFQYLIFPTGNWRIAQNTGTTAFFDAHINTSSERLFHWSEGSNTVFWNDISLFSSWQWGPYTSPQPDGNDWLSYANGFPGGNILTGTRSGNRVYFGWMAGPDSSRNGTLGIPRVHIELVAFDTASLALTNQYAFWSTSYDMGVPALTTDLQGDIGMACEWGGQGHYNNFAVGVMVPITFITLYEMASVTNSTNGVTRYGDYVTIQPQYPQQNAFSAGGYAVQQDASTGNLYSDPHYVVFHNG